MHDLFGGAFEPLGIREYADPRWTTPTSRCLTDGANWLWVYADDEGAVTHMKRCGLFNIAEAILAKIHEVFGVDIVSEHEPAYWGFSTQQEWNEWQDEMAREASTAPGACVLRRTRA